MGGAVSSKQRPVDATGPPQLADGTASGSTSASASASVASNAGKPAVKKLHISGGPAGSGQRRPSIQRQGSRGAEKPDFDFLRGESHSKIDAGRRAQSIARQDVSSEARLNHRRRSSLDPTAFKTMMARPATGSMVHATKGNRSQHSCASSGSSSGDGSSGVMRPANQPITKPASALALEGRPSQPAPFTRALTSRMGGTEHTDLVTMLASELTALDMQVASAQAEFSKFRALHVAAVERLKTHVDPDNNLALINAQGAEQEHKLDFFLKQRSTLEQSLVELVRSRNREQPAGSQQPRPQGPQGIHSTGPQQLQLGPKTPNFGSQRVD